VSGSGLQPVKAHNFAHKRHITCFVPSNWKERSGEHVVRALAILPSLSPQVTLRLATLFPCDDSTGPKEDINTHTRASDVDIVEHYEIIYRVLYGVYGSDESKVYLQGTYYLQLKDVKRYRKLKVDVHEPYQLTINRRFYPAPSTQRSKLSWTWYMARRTADEMNEHSSQGRNE
jgi:hypothetical protein